MNIDEIKERRLKLLEDLKPILFKFMEDNPELNVNIQTSFTTTKIGCQDNVITGRSIDLSIII